MLHVSYIFLITCLNMDYFFVSWSWRNIPQVQPFRWSYDILSPCGWSCRVMLFGMSLVSLHNHPSDAPRPWWNARCHGRRRGIKQKQQKRGKFWWENREKWYNYNYIYIIIITIIIFITIITTIIIIIIIYIYTPLVLKHGNGKSCL